MTTFNLAIFLLVATTACASNLRTKSNIPSDASAKLEDLASAIQETSVGDRELGFICNRIEAVFDGNVSCDCCGGRLRDLFRGEVPFSCSFLETACTPDTGAGTFCGKPTYSGSILIRLLRREFTLKNKVCVADLALNGAPIGGDSIALGNLCVDAELCFVPGQGFGICQCSAAYLGLDCSCSPCDTGDGGTGVSLACPGGIASEVCLPLNFPQAGSSDGEVQPFIPMLTAPED